MSITIKFLKAWKGEVAVAPGASLAELLSALKMASSIEPASCAAMIARGKKIDLAATDSASPIETFGLAHNTSVMLVLHDPQMLQMQEQERRMQRLAEVESAARLLSERAGDGSSGFEMSLTNQDGSAISMPEADRKALSLGMMLHAKGRALLERSSQSMLAQQQEGGPAIEAAAGEASTLQETLQLFEAAERAMDVADRKWLELSDNMALLLLDAVWASLLLSSRQADAALSEPAAQAAASARLERAKGLLQRLHGPQMERLAGRSDAGQQRAVYVRLGVLQGALAYHRGELHDARSLLVRADGMRRELTLTPEDDGKVAELLAMGFAQHEARSALLACGKDVGAAAACVLQRRGAAQARVEAQREKRRRSAELKTYGLTPMGRAVDAHGLEQLVGLGYVRPLAAEALRQSENDINEALSALGSAERQEALQLACMQRAAPPPAFEPSVESIAGLQAMGFGEAAARRALVKSHGNLEQAVAALTTEGGGAVASGGASSASDAAAAAAPPTAAAFSAENVAAAVAGAAAAAAAEEETEAFDDEQMHAISQSGLEHAVKASERAYEAINLDLEAAALGYFLAIVESRLA